MDELEFEEVFCKDSRNRRGTDNGKKRCNYKEVLKRSHQEAKREKQRCEQVQQQSDEGGDEEPRKYENGKKGKCLKVQQYYVEADIGAATEVKAKRKEKIMYSRGK